MTILYKIIIVDDEPEIVKWLSELLKEINEYELEIMKAYSAKEALVWLEKTKIDIILLDIRMPGITGLQLLEKIKASWPYCKVIFLTGYNKFEYVYNAIQTQGVKYLLKIEKDEKIIQAVIDSIIEIEADFLDKDIKNKAQEQIDRMSYFLKEEYLNELIHGYYTDIEIVKESLQHFKIQFNMDRKLIMVLGRFDNLPLDTILTDRHSYIYSLKILTEQHISDTNQIEFFLDSKANFIWLIQPKNMIDDTTENDICDIKLEEILVILTGALENIQNSCRISLGVTISFFIGCTPFYLDSIREKYKCLRRLMRYRIGLGTEMILSDNHLSQQAIDDCEDESIISDNYQHIKLRDNIESLLETNQKNEFFKLFSRMIEDLKKVKTRNDNLALEIYYSASILFLNYINKRKLAKKLGSRMDLHKLTRADEHVSWEKAIDYLYDLANAIFDIQSEDEERRSVNAITKIQQYIDENLDGDLSLTKLGEIVYLNPTYLSRLFKQVTGEKISDYIYHIRIKKAKELLAYSAKKINEISLEIGYESPNSFTRSFKSSVGVPPQEYREFYINK